MTLQYGKCELKGYGSGLYVNSCIFCGENIHNNNEWQEHFKGYQYCESYSSPKKREKKFESHGDTISKSEFGLTWD